MIAMLFATRLKNRIPILLLFTILSCSKSDNNGSQNVKVTNVNTVLNPSGIAPLTATIHLETSVPTTVQMRIVGKNGTASDFTHSFPDLASTHDLNILGLYAGYKNVVELTFFNQSGANGGTQKIEISTSPIIPDLPQVNIKTAEREKMTPGMTLVSYFGYAASNFPQTPFIFDSWGEIRWYLNFKSDAGMQGLFYDDGVERLQNGNLYFGDIATSQIYEYDMMGYRKNSWPLPGYHFHHQVLEKPDGNFLVCASKDGESTVEDQILEIDRNTKSIIHQWDLRQSLDYDRTTLTGNRQDWIHVNAIAYDPADDGIIVSGRTQGVAKIDRNNQVLWILGCHEGWGMAGNGSDLNDFLLTPVDQSGNLITDPDILNGLTNHSDFEWNWYQHATKLLPNGNILLFDNGDNRNFTGLGPYSRAVIYEIDPVAKTVKQVWTYGKGNGASTFSRIVSDVDFEQDKNHIIFSPGAVNFSSAYYGEVQEVDYSSREIIFDAQIIPPNPLFSITFHRTERLNLYP